MTREEAREAAQQRVFISYTRGDLENDCRKYGLRTDWNVRTCKRRTLEQFLIKKLTDEIYKENKKE